MSTLRKLVRRMPGAQELYSRAGRWYRLRVRGGAQPAAVFSDIHTTNKWGGRESASGKGSDVEQTRVVVRELPGIFREFDVRTILNIPCGDFHWMRHVDREGVAYLGGDIVPDLIRHNEEEYSGEQVRFQVMDLLSDPLPTVDLILCRDCLVHFAYSDLFAALRNICDSNSGYLLTTTFTGRDRNRDIWTGHWRPLNLQAAPFDFSPPLHLLSEGCTEGDGNFGDKSLALWRIEDLREHLRPR